jgi:SOS-response transcriptional repressor LexA
MESMKKSELRQQEILAYMKKTISEKGYSPTVREIRLLR